MSKRAIVAIGFASAIAVAVLTISLSGQRPNGQEVDTVPE